VNLVIAGHCPTDVAPVFIGGRLLALNKKTGGIRPIAIGLTLRRLASKCANSFGIKKLSSYFYPHQLGIDTPGGCEAAVRSARRYIETLPQDHVLVKLDSNAFNSISLTGSKNYVIWLHIRFADPSESLEWLKLQGSKLARRTIVRSRR